MIIGKVQTTKDNVNVLVETQDSSNSHYHHFNVNVNVNKVLTDIEILEIWRNRDLDMQELELDLAKNWLKKQPNYAVSNCVDYKNNITYNSIIQYKL